jgi:hypothetical protein
MGVNTPKFVDLSHIAQQWASHYQALTKFHNMALNPALPPAFSLGDKSSVAVYHRTINEMIMEEYTDILL